MEENGNATPEYTEEEIKSLREILKKAGIERIPISLKVKDIYKNGYMPKTGDVLWVYLLYADSENNIEEGWHKIKVTYHRSGVLFFKYEGKGKETHALTDSYFIQNAIPARIDIKDTNIQERNLPLIEFTFETSERQLETTIIKADGTEIKVKNN